MGNDRIDDAQQNEEFVRRARPHSRRCRGAPRYHFSFSACELCPAGLAAATVSTTPAL